jgi:hypothetical protein
MCHSLTIVKDGDGFFGAVSSLHTIAIVVQIHFPRSYQNQSFPRARANRHVNSIKEIQPKKQSKEGTNYETQHQPSSASLGKMQLEILKPD